MATELTTVQSHAPINKPQIEEAPAKYSYLDVALGKGDDSCMKTIKIAAAVLTLGATLVLAGVMDLMSHAWSWITGPSAEAHEISVVPTDVEEVEVPATPTPAVITTQEEDAPIETPVAIITETEEEVEVQAPVVAETTTEEEDAPIETPVAIITETEEEVEVQAPVVAETTTEEAPKDDSYIVTRMAKNVASTVKDYSVAAWNKGSDAAVSGFNGTTKFISQHKKETVMAGAVIGASYLGYRYSAEIGGMASSVWTQDPTWQGTKDTFHGAGTWVKENTWDRMPNMPSWGSTETPKAPKGE